MQVKTLTVLLVINSLEILFFLLIVVSTKPHVHPPEVKQSEMETISMPNVFFLETI